MRKICKSAVEKRTDLTLGKKRLEVSGVKDCERQTMGGRKSFIKVSWTVGQTDRKTDITNCRVKTIKMKMSRRKSDYLI